ncbi:hypothetical protein MesoLjLc_29830 [Mesorhizobium sp. L-8-10]|nr:hypothetical protein MesoLjLc_29830 [Mesorhizobium sp. L-8-10]
MKDGEKTACRDHGARSATLTIGEAGGDIGLLPARRARRWHDERPANAGSSGDPAGCRQADETHRPAPDAILLKAVQAAALNQNGFRRYFRNEREASDDWSNVTCSARDQGGP